jgi:NAD/NADP transhydrogenase alpha subunit
MYARNVHSFLGQLSGEDGILVFDFDNQIVAEACITHEGRVTHPVVRRRMGLEAVQ